MSKVFKILIALLLIANLVAVSWSGEAEHGFYPLAVTVDHMEPERDIVVFADGAGVMWEICGIEDWALGDIAAFLMDDSGTPDFIYDDSIAAVRYGFNPYSQEGL